MILLVEDDTGVREALAEYLRASHYEVEATAAPAEALGRAAEWELCPDLVVTDINMPEMTGPEMIQQLQRRWPDLKMIFMTGYADDFLMNTTFATARVLAKPFTFRTLADTIHEVLEPTLERCTHQRCMANPL